MEELRRLTIGQMPVVSGDPLFERPRVVPIPQHVAVMVELEDGNVQGGQLLGEQPRWGPKVGDDADPRVAACHGKADRVTRIVGNGHGLNTQAAKLK